MYINHHSFSSLHGFVKGYAKISKSMAKLGLKLLGINPLKASKALSSVHHSPLAENTLVVTASNDETIKRSAKLENQLVSKNTSNNITFITAKLFSHDAEKSYALSISSHEGHNPDKEPSKATVQAYLKELEDNPEFLEDIAKGYIQNKIAHAKKSQDKQEMEMAQKLAKLEPGMREFLIKSFLMDYIKDELDDVYKESFKRIFNAIEETKGILHKYTDAIEQWAHPKIHKIDFVPAPVPLP